MLIAIRSSQIIYVECVDVECVLQSKMLTIDNYLAHFPNAMCDWTAVKCAHEHVR